MKRSGHQSSLTELLLALGEKVRLRILRLLEREELSVGEVAKVVQLPQSTVSRHLKVLADGGWLGKRTEGTATLYRLVLDDLPIPSRALWVVVRDQLTGPGSQATGAGGMAAELAEDARRLVSVLAERREDSQAFFGRVAGEWDDVRNELFGKTFTLRAMLSLLPRDWTVADLGCGTGNATELLAPVVRKVIAVDQSAPMLAAAKKRLLVGKSGGATSNVEFVRGELESLPLPDACADAAVGVLVMGHVTEPVRALREVRRILRPGGVSLIIDMVEHDRNAYRRTLGQKWQGFSESAITGAMREAGFAAARYLVLDSDPEAGGPGLFACTAFAGAADAK